MCGEVAEEGESGGDALAAKGGGEVEKREMNGVCDDAGGLKCGSAFVGEELKESDEGERRGGCAAV